MIATIDGMKVEGTPEEIVHFITLRNKQEGEAIMEKKRQVPYPQGWWGIYPPVGCDSTSITYQMPEIHVQNETDIKKIAKALSERVSTASRA